MLSSRESFLNGFELHLDDDIDAVAVESFWAFVSGGSPLLSAFEWILMVHHIGKLEEVVEREVVCGETNERQYVRKNRGPRGCVCVGVCAWMTE